MPLFERETLEGAIRKALGRTERTKQQTSNQCQHIETQLRSLQDELRRRIREYQQAKREADQSVQRINDASDEAETADQHARRTAIIDAFAIGPGTLHGLVRAADPGQFRPNDSNSALSNLIRDLEGAVFPDRRARYTEFQRGDASGQSRAAFNAKERAFTALKDSRDRYLDKALELQRCQLTEQTPELINSNLSEIERIRRGTR